MPTRRFALTALASTALLAGTASLPGTAAAQDPIVINFGIAAADGTPWAAQLREIKKRIETESEGRIVVRLRLGGVPAGSGSMFDSLTASDLTGTTVRYSSLFSSGGGWYRSCGCSGCGSTNISGGTVNVNSDWNHFSESTTPIRWDDGLAVEVDIYWGSSGILGPALTAGLPPSSCHACCPWNCIGDFMSGKLNPDGTATINTGVSGYTATLAAGLAPSIGTWHTLSFEVSPSGCSF